MVLFDCRNTCSWFMEWKLQIVACISLEATWDTIRGNASFILNLSKSAKYEVNHNLVSGRPYENWVQMH